MGTLGTWYRALTVRNGSGWTNNVAPGPYTWPDFNFSRTFAYNVADPTNPILIQSTPFSFAAAQAGGALDLAWALASSSPYVGSSGADRYKLTGNYTLDGTHHILDSGLAGVHPYLNGVSIPSYIGAVDPNNDGWVDTVLSLSDINNLKREVVV
jgi:hypothetical protein